MKYYDEVFLKKLNKMRLRTHYVKIILLSFEENPIKEIQGRIVSGNISVNSSSAIRRTLSLSMVVDENNADITNIENEISINKKIKVEIGLENPFQEYIEQYGKIVWFSQGIYVLSSTNSSRSTNGWTLSITAKDKMCLLDGSAGGSFPAATVLSDRYVYLKDGSVQIEYPVLREIIFEAVNHYGGENPDNIFINDLEDTVKMLVKYDGFNTLYLKTKNTQKNGIYTFTQPNEGEYKTFTYGDDVGYMITDFTYPGELTLNAGETVVTLLDKIVKVLGNYEYFYDIDGHFIFQEIKNYVNTQSPLNELTEDDYVRVYDTNRSAYQLTDLDAAAAITYTPKYDNIKNDFIVWGQRSENHPIHYHLAIDAKPYPDKSMKYMWPVYNNKGELIDYQFTPDNKKPKASTDTTIGEPEYPCPSSYEWREELYREALYAQTKTGFGSGNNYYYEELIGFWRDLYDPGNADWSANQGWNPDVKDHPENLSFWLDLIDTGSALGSYSVGQIGRRTKAVNKNDIKTIYNKEVPDILFISSGDSIPTNQNICKLPASYKDLFSISTTGASCFDEIRDLLWQHLNYHATISVTCLPIYYLEPNSILYIEDAKSGIIGNYQITQFSIPLAYNGTMSITATEVFARI